jgi:hypothetical protein
VETQCSALNANEMKYYLLEMKADFKKRTFLCSVVTFQNIFLVAQVACPILEDEEKTKRITALTKVVRNRTRV